VPFNDLKIFRRYSHLRIAMCGGLNHVHRQTRFLSSNGASSAPRFPSVHRSLQRQLQGQRVLLPRTLSLHGLRPADLSRKPAVYSNLVLRAQKSKLYHMGIRSSISRNNLANANKVRDWRIYADLAYSLIRTARKLYVNDSFGLELENRLRAGCHHYRLVALHVPMGSLPKEQGSHQATYAVGSAGQHPNLRPHIRRQTARSEYRATGSRSILCHGSRLSGLCTPVHSFTGLCLLRNRANQISNAGGVIPIR